MKKYLLFIIICISSFIIYTNNVKADTLSTGIYGVNFVDSLNTSLWQTNCSNLSPDIGIGACSINQNFTISANDNAYGYLYITNGANLSNKTVSFSFYRDYMTDIDLTGISLIDNTRLYSCEIYNTISNSNGQLYNLICPNLPTLTGNGTAIVFLLRNYSSSPRDFSRVKFGISSINGWSTYDTAMQDIISRLDTNNTNISNIINKLNDIKNNTDSTNSKLEDIKSKLDSQNSNTNAIKNNTEEIKNDIKSDNVSGAEGSADDLKNNSAFQDNSGLSGVISMPLTFVNSLTNTCQPINLNIPYMDVDVTIPCMQPIITNKMPLLANLIKIIVNGFIVYRILLDIFQIVRNAKNPEDDRIEVLDL